MRSFGHLPDKACDSRLKALITSTVVACSGVGMVESEIDTATRVEAVTPAKPLWVAPKISVEHLNATAGDPTIADDGLGDGLFS